jgi:hypothetical protein
MQRTLTYYSGSKVGFVGQLWAVRSTGHKILIAVIAESKQHLETLWNEGLLFIHKLYAAKFSYRMLKSKVARFPACALF